MDSTIQGCSFEKIDGEPDIARNVAIACGTCALYDIGGKAQLMIDDDGFTNVIDGMCPRFGIYSLPQEIAPEAIKD